MRETITDLREAYPGGDEPGTCVAWCRHDGDVLRLGVLADCVAVVGDGNGNVTTLVADDRVEALDADVARAYVELVERDGLTPAAAREAVRPLLVANRKLANTPGPSGYWLLADDPQAAEHASGDTVAVTGDMTVLLATDGFTRTARMGSRGSPASRTCSRRARRGASPASGRLCGRRNAMTLTVSPTPVSACTTT